MKISQLVPEVSLRVAFTLRYRKFVPREPGCYVLTTLHGDVLYIGLTDDLHRRFGDHRGDDEKCEPTPHGTAYWFYYLPYELSKLETLERTWLNIYVVNHGERPFFNKVDSPIR